MLRLESTCSEINFSISYVVNTALSVRSESIHFSCRLLRNSCVFDVFFLRVSPGTILSTFFLSSAFLISQLALISIIKSPKIFDLLHSVAVRLSIVPVIGP